MARESMEIKFVMIRKIETAKNRTAFGHIHNCTHEFSFADFLRFFFIYYNKAYTT